MEYRRLNWLTLGSVAALWIIGAYVFATLAFVFPEESLIEAVSGLMALAFLFGIPVLVIVALSNTTIFDVDDRTDPPGT